MFELQVLVRPLFAFVKAGLKKDTLLVVVPYLFSSILLICVAIENFSSLL